MGNEAGELGSHAADALRAGVEALSYEHYDELVDLCILRRRVREQAEQRRLAQRSEDSRAWASAVSAGGLAAMPSVRKARRVLLARGGAGTADEWLDAEWSAAGDATRDNGSEGGRSDGGGGGNGDDGRAGRGGGGEGRQPGRLRWPRRWVPPPIFCLRFGLTTHASVNDHFAGLSSLTSVV